jgi:drug/metabolite transporter (DMT)-like permease
LSEPKERIICTDAPNNPNLLAGYISVFVAAALFGSAFTVAKQPLANTDPLLLSSVVYVITGLSLIPVAKASSSSSASPSRSSSSTSSLFSVRYIKRINLLYLFIVSILGAVIAPLLLFYGLKQTTASDGSILANAEIVFTIILSSIFLRKT